MDNDQLGRGTDGVGRPSSRPGALRRLGLPAAALSIALGAGQLAGAAPSFAATQSASTQTGNVAVGHAPALPHNSVSAAAPAASKKLTLDVELNTGHAAALSAYAAGVSDKNSSYYHHYLTPSQVAADFGASKSEIAAVEASLRAQGLTVGSVSSNGMFISATGTVAQSEHAFNVNIKGYKASGRTFYANTTAPTMAASVASDVSGILGLDNVDYALPRTSTTHHTAKAASVGSKVTSNYTVNSCSTIANTFSQYGLTNGTDYYTDDSISSIYGLSSLLTNGNDGAGVTVGVFELESYDATGVADMDSCYGHSTTSVTEQAVDGGPTTAANMYNNVGVESALDIENIANLAPGASIIDYAGPDASSATDAQVLDVFNTMITADTAKVISDSWGQCEVLTKSSDSTFQASENTLFETAATQGQTVLVASGDNGSTDCYGAGVTADNTVLSVDDPASQPYVTAVGGTTMSGLSNPTPSTWNECQGTNTDCGASGGGVSNTWSLPTWQSKAKASGYSTECTSTVSQGGTGCRELPDVSALADPTRGYVIEEYYNDGVAADTPGESLGIIGGTSGAAPVWAAIIALADASTTCKVGGAAGSINSQLYTVGTLSSTASSAFATDVTTGNNKITADGATYGYSAGTGYDMATGWGTPKAAGVVSTVCQAPSYYQADGPTRLLDTRSGKLNVGGIVGPIAKNGTVTIQITGKNSVPSGATAAVLNVTVTQPSGAGNATVYPATETMPLTSNLNWTAGQTTPNLVVVPLNSDGAVKITNNSTGTVQFIADLEGYFTTSTTVSSVTSSSYTPAAPTRALDTRSGGNGVSKAKVAEQSAISLQVGGASITPVGGGTALAIPSGITGIAMNVTVTNVTGGGYLAVYPNETASGTTVTTPNVSNLNFSVGQTVANMVMVPVGKDGKVDFFNGAISGSTDVIADIAGYYTAGTSGDVYHPLGPVRVIDTRKSENASGAIASKGTLNLALPSSYKAIISNVTVTQPASGGFVNVYPLNGTRPNVSNVNFGTGQTIPNMAIVQSTSGVTFYNNASGTVQLVVDLSGYFSAS